MPESRSRKINKEDLRKLLDSAWPTSERHEVVRSLTKAATKGDVRAAALLMAYGYGKPVQPTEKPETGANPTHITYDWNQIRELEEEELEELHQEALAALDSNGE